MLSLLQQGEVDRIASWEVDTPHDILQADSVQDAFELLAPSVTGPLVARLIPLPTDAACLSAIDIYRDVGSVTLGRSKQLTVECRIDVALVSGRHCELHVSPITRQVTIKDISTNGTYVNGKRVEKAAELQLESGDHVSLTKPTNSTENSGSGAEYIFQRVSSATTVEALKDELTCPACKLLYIRPCSALPCMHVFCAACISKWLNNGNTTCIQCRAEVLEVRPTHRIQSCVEELVKANPHLERNRQEKADCLAFDDIPSIGKIVQKRHRNEDDYGSDYDSISDDNEDKEDSGTAHNMLLVPKFDRGAYGHIPSRGPCRHCDSASCIDGFRCPANAPHLCCLQCARIFPNRPLCNRPQSCQLCRSTYCNLYYEEEGGCPSGSNGGLTRLYQFCPGSALPQRTFGGNAVEQKILFRYLSAKGIQLRDVWEECMTMFQKGEWIPDISCVNEQLTLDAPLCERCMNIVFDALLFHYRRSVCRDELPEEVTNRPNCWYGINCRTQFHKTEHANNYNHVCYQEKRKE